MLKTGLLLGSVFATVAGTAAAAPERVSRSEPARLSVQYSVDTTGGIPIEGAVSYLVLRRAATGLKTPRIMVLRAELWGTGPITMPVPSGRYRISAYQRTCNASCSTLAAPSNGCGRDLRIHPGEAIKARVRVRFGDDERCRITVRRSALGGRTSRARQ